MSLQRALLLFLIALTSACSHTPEQHSIRQEIKPAKRPLSGDTLYSLLTAELASQRGRYDIALGNYIQQAHRTRDIGVTSRATQIAMALEAHQAALDTSLLWLQLDPQSEHARQIAIEKLARQGQLNEALELANSFLNDQHATIFFHLAALSINMLPSAQELLFQRYQQLLQQYPNHPGLLSGLSILQQQRGQFEQALVSCRLALDSNAQYQPALRMEIRLLRLLKRDQEALKILTKLAHKQQLDRSLRLEYARLLSPIDLKQARVQFAALLTETPNNSELLLTLALIDQELGELKQAKQALLHIVELGKLSHSAHYHLGNIAAIEQRYEQAISHYQQVTSGQEQFSALHKSSTLLLQDNRVAETLKQLDHSRQRLPEKAEQLYLLEAQLLRRHVDLESSLESLDRALALFSNNSELRYMRAMNRERAGHMQGAEADFRALLKDDPENPAVLNALGYALVTHTTRFQEALTLIERAYALKPNDAAIIDSLGWVHFRLGNNAQALTHLKRAMNTMPDHEIAAHLGEVLWHNQDQQEARRIWQQGLQLEPQSPILHETLNRLQVEF